MLKPLKIIALLLISSFSFAQVTTPPPPEEDGKEPEFTFEKPKSNFSQKLRYGGNFWLGFFGAFYVDASPMAGLELNEKGTVAGLGATFIYQGGFNQGGSFYAGPRLFVRQPVWRTIFAQAEFEIMNAPETQFYSYTDAGTGGNTGARPIDRIWQGSPLIGGGWYQNRNREQKGSFISVMYNLGYNYGKGFVSPQGLGGNGSPIILRFGIFI